MKSHSDFIVELFNIDSKKERLQFLDSYVQTLSSEEFEAWKNGNTEPLNAPQNKNTTDKNNNNPPPKKK